MDGVKERYKMKGQVEIIKSKSSLSDRAKNNPSDKLRVAAYCRVSTDDEDQINSYNSQIEYYKEYVQKEPSWALVGIYADEAISGVQTKKRDDFQRLINDCMNGEIDMVITKAISRFARNTLDTLKYVRMLKEKHIAVYFEEERINTLTMDGELLLTILSSVAQQEVENTSAHVKKGLKMKMARGELVGYNGCLGYDYNKENKTMTVNEAEAAIVRYIFNRYIEGAGASIIARELMEQGVKGKKGSAVWHDSTVRGIIRNEKYIGDLLMGKTFTVDPINKRRLVNMGEEDKFYIREHHEPIISKTVFYKAQEIMDMRAGSRVLGEAFKRKKYSRMYAFSSMLRCGFCGAALSRRAWNSGTQYEKVIWHCVTHTGKGKRFCPHCKGIDETVIEKAFVESFNRICRDSENVLDEFLSRISETLYGHRKKNNLIEQLEMERYKLKQRRSKLCDTFLEGDIEKGLFDEKKEEIDEELKEVDYQINKYKSEAKEAENYESRIEEFRKLLLQNQEMESFDRAIFESVIDTVIIGGNNELNVTDPAMIVFVYKAGIKGEKEYENKSNTSKMNSRRKAENAKENPFDKMEKLPEYIELFEFYHHYKHIIFDKMGQDVIQKKLKDFCQVKVSMAI